ncbi:MAG: dihydroneopterin aldolase [Pseudomonadota bacterium]
MTQSHRVAPFPPAPKPDATAGLRRIFVRDLVLLADIGVYRREQGKAQRVRISFELLVDEPRNPTTDRLKDVVNYAKVIDAVRALVGRGRVNLVETLAEQIADCCLADPRVRRAGVQVEKLDAVPDAASVGVEIERWRGQSR